MRETRIYSMRLQNDASHFRFYDWFLIAGSPLAKICFLLFPRSPIVSIILFRLSLVHHFVQLSAFVRLLSNSAELGTAWMAFVVGLDGLWIRSLKFLRWYFRCPLIRVATPIFVVVSEKTNTVDGFFLSRKNPSILVAHTLRDAPSRRNVWKVRGKNDKRKDRAVCQWKCIFYGYNRMFSVGSRVNGITWIHWKSTGMTSRDVVAKVA